MRRSVSTWVSSVLVDPEPVGVPHLAHDPLARHRAAGVWRRAARAGRTPWAVARAPRRRAMRARAPRSTPTPPARSGSSGAWCAGSARATQVRPNAGQQLREPERLDEVIVSTGIEPGDDVELLVARRDDQDRQLRPAPRSCRHTSMPSAKRGKPRRVSAAVAWSRTARVPLTSVSAVAPACPSARSRLSTTGSSSLMTRSVRQRARATPRARTACACCRDRRGPAAAGPRALRSASPVRRTDRRDRRRRA